jgi:hypothetical protein
MIWRVANAVNNGRQRFTALKKNAMAKKLKKRGDSKYRVDGILHRVQLTVFDFSEGPASLRKPTTFSAIALPQSEHPSTAYSHGNHLYYGESLEDAIAAIEARLGKIELHQSLAKYLRNKQ